jgi:hypothetical protein
MHYIVSSIPVKQLSFVSVLTRSYFSQFDQSSTYGRKIDLLLRYSQDKKHHMETSANEWKRGDVKDDMKINQRLKNWRTNASILQQLVAAHGPHLIHVTAMDFIGNSRYLYFGAVI